jgi:3-keto-disaccharide hydrolase
MNRSERRQLFNGSDLSGWQMAGSGAFNVVDGSLKTEGGMGLLWYTGERFGDCLLRVVYKTTRFEDNSGVFIRIAERPPDAWFAVHNGYEVQICAGQDEWHRSGVIYSMTRTDIQADKPAGEWNTLDIELNGDLVRVTMNGVRLTDFDPSQPVPPRQRDYEPERGPRPTHGYIGLQNHDSNSIVYFREVSVGPLVS